MLQDRRLSRAGCRALVALCNLISLYFGYTGNVLEFGYCFTLGITLFGVAIVLYIVELQLATRALDTHLQDLEEL